MLLTDRKRYIFLVLIMSGTVSMKEDLADKLTIFVAKVLAGLELTSLYLFSLGTAYPPIEKDVTFFCVKPGGKELIQTFLGDPNIESKIDFRYCINIIIHGWLSGLDGGNRYLPEEVRATDSWMRPAALAWAQQADCNVCAVDWSRLANYDYSVAALVNTKKVANHIIDFMEFLEDFDMKVEDCAIAGHSLGAHIAGIIGRYFGGIVAVIYGMDPAGPGFTVPWDFGAGSRLTKSDARYVQCMHTSCGTIGTLKHCGHADFYLNGGFVQPGCLGVMCSHSRAHDYFAESLDPNHVFSGVKCRGQVKSFVTNLLGMRCSSQTDRIGIHSARKPGRYFLKTNSKTPFAKKVISSIKKTVVPSFDEMAISDSSQQLFDSIDFSLGENL